MVHLRKVLFILFTLLYLVACPALILYSLGIIIKPERKKIIKTGVIYINTIPSEASIVLNNKLYTEETPTVIDNLLPGSYTLKITAPNYHPWETTVEVLPEKATPLDNILLLPDPIKTSSISPWPVKQLITIQDNPFVLATTGEKPQEYFLHIWDESFPQNLLPDKDSQSTFLKPVFTNASDSLQGRITQTYSTIASPYVIFQIESSEGTHFFWSDLLLGTNKTQDISHLFPIIPNDIQWSESDPRHIYSLAEHALNRIDIATHALYPKIIDNVDIFTVFNQTIFYLTTQKYLLKSTINSPKNTSRPASTNAVFNDLVLKNAPFTKISAFSENFLFLLGKNGQFISNLKPYLISDNHIIGFSWHKKPQKIVFWNYSHIGFIDYTQNTKAPQISWLDFSFKKISQVYWITDATHLLINDGDKIYLANVNCCGLSHVRKIIDTKAGSSINYSSKSGKIFFIDKDTQALSSVDIIPAHSLPSSSVKAPKKKDTKPQP